MIIVVYCTCIVIYSHIHILPLTPSHPPHIQFALTLRSHTQQHIHTIHTHNTYTQHTHNAYTRTHTQRTLPSPQELSSSATMFVSPNPLTPLPLTPSHRPHIQIALTLRSHTQHIQHIHTQHIHTTHTHNTYTQHIHTHTHTHPPLTLRTLRQCDHVRRP